MNTTLGRLFLSVILLLAVIAQKCPDIKVTVVDLNEARIAAWNDADLSKLPEDASETLRVIRVGEYDACACIGQHVVNTSELGTFEIISHDFENGRWRVRFKLV
jgi:Ser-tRNA(Ala) deacylase AlaX